MTPTAILEQEGFLECPDFLSPKELQELRSWVETEVPPLLAPRQHSLRFFLHRCPSTRAFLKSQKVFERASGLLAGATLFRSIYFDKNPDRNWKVPWHQDRCVVTEERRDLEGFHAWSVKDQRPHVFPPQSILEAVTTLRIHLDDCLFEEGSLRVLPGSHRYGPCEREDLPPEQRDNFHACTGKAGHAVFMKPLIFHSSTPCRRDQVSRRVLHFEFAHRPLPQPLRYNQRP